MGEKEPKIVFEEKLKCPHCKKKIIVKKTRKMLVPSVAAEYEEKINIEKDFQETLKGK